MPRYRSSGGLDDVPVEDGDAGFLGVNMRVPSWQLPPGMLSLSENGRIDGEWIPRKGVDIVTNESLASGTPLRLPFWLIDASGGLTVSAASRVGEAVTLTVTGHGLPVGGSPASLIVNPPGADNSILFTAVESGMTGGEISIEYVALPVGSFVKTIISVDSNAIKVNYGSGEYVTIAGTLEFLGSPVIIPPLYLKGPSVDGTRNDFQALSRDPYCVWQSNQWVLGSATGYTWLSSDNVATPDLVTTWTPATLDETGTPVVTLTALTVATAAHVINAIADDGIALALVTAAASGASTGSVSVIGPVFLQGGATSSAYTGLEGVTTPTVDPNGSWDMTPTGFNTLTFSIPGATGSETYTVTSAKLRSVIDDFATGDLLGACAFSDPSSANDQYIFLAYGLNVKRVRLSDSSVTTINLPASESIEGGVSMIQAFNKVYIFRPGKVALEWESGDTAFTAVPSGAYTQPQILSSNGSAISISDGLVTFAVTGNTTIAANDSITIYSATDTRFTNVVGKQYFVKSASSTTITCFIGLPNSASGSNTVQIGKQVSVGGGFIFQPGFPWAIYFQRRLWGPYQYFWDTSLTPDGFSSRNITDEIIASDILDGDTYDAIENQYRITGGTADSVVALHPFFDDTLLVLNRNSIHAISGTVGSLADTTVKELTREIGCLARRSVVSQGNAVFFLSDNGIYGLAFANDYNLRGIERPLSANIQPYIDRISRSLASGAVAAYHDNRYFIAVPLDSAPRQGDATGNNAILIYNLLNNEWESVDTFADPSFLITDLLIASSGTRNDLYAVSITGGIHIMNSLDETYDRIASNQIAGAQIQPIAARLRTRGFMGGTAERKRFTSVGVQMKSGISQTDVGISFATEDPDNSGTEELASKGLRGPLAPDDTADCRVRVGGIRGFNGSVTIRRVIGRPAVRGVRVSATETNRATTTQK